MIGLDGNRDDLGERVLIRLPDAKEDIYGSRIRDPIELPVDLGLARTACRAGNQRGSGLYQLAKHVEEPKWGFTKSTDCN